MRSISDCVAIADAGIYYGKDIYDQERYVEMKEILVELMSRIDGRKQPIRLNLC